MTILLLQTGPAFEFHFILEQASLRRSSRCQWNASYCKIADISPGLIDISKHISGGLYSRGITFGVLIFGGQFVLVSPYSRL